ncbi:MAG: helix-turn-helix transcriptional regulator [Lachnospiraceae bacterium]|nr:helix-turn-helix transcriptional regulator [Lachnospiraceae bacterium]MCM1234309.1 helix-turn-helix transcriptional regulator [Ruminococcus flavefaciens]
MTLNQAFAIRVREVLKEKKMTQYRLEQETGIYHSTMTSILGNKTKASNFKNIALIIRELGLSMADFFNSPVFDFDNLDIED